VAEKREKRDGEVGYRAAGSAGDEEGPLHVLCGGCGEDRAVGCRGTSDQDSTQEQKHLQWNANMAGILVNCKSEFVIDGSEWGRRRKIEDEGGREAEVKKGGSFMNMNLG
jgi:hypothetical protein